MLTDQQQQQQQQKSLTASVLKQDKKTQKVEKNT